MFITTRGTYATRAMLELAEHYGDRPLSSAAIGEAQDISARYLQQLLGALKRAGLVRVNMGPGGGFTLARPPAEVTVGAILDAAEGRICLVDCAACKRARACITRPLWKQAGDMLNGYFAELSLADVLKGHGHTRAQARRASGKHGNGHRHALPARHGRGGSQPALGH